MDSLNSAFDFLTPELAKKAWLDTKLTYAKHKGAHSRSDMETYRRSWIDKFHAKSHLAFLQG